jgi:protease IV
VTPNKGQRILGLVILILCIISVPVGLWGKSSSGSDDKSDKASDASFPLLIKKDRIQVIKLGGMIMNDDSNDSLIPDRNSSNYVRKQLRKAAKDDHIKAVLLYINSPGGTVAMSQEISDAVRELKEKQKIVYASMGDVAASGGYYIASQADKIYACPGTLTGSIGVIMHLMSLQEIEQKVGVKPYTIKSGEFKDIGTMDRPPTKAEETLLKDIIMDSYDQFITAVSEGRKMDKEVVRKLADGRIYSGRQALKVKLVDSLGGYEEALSELKKVCKDKYNKDLAVDEGRSSSIIGALLESTAKPLPKLDVFSSVIPESMNPRFLNQPMWIMQ